MGQPLLGLAGVVVVILVFLVVTYRVGPLCTYGLPAVAMVAFWWRGWPFDRVTRRVLASICPRPNRTRSWRTAAVAWQTGATVKAASNGLVAGGGEQQ
ncbi:hypothetical protein ACFQ1S_02860 [Kibdelosporangium lantanae]|uniref:Uncharacterized protein n=1 Tax=Kibdelosporangium lantanae TaxID=1497396 RepID=A0ABW3M3C9_9PSEU